MKIQTGVIGSSEPAVLSRPFSPPTAKAHRILSMPDANLLAHTSRAIQVARELRALGYEVVFASDGQYAALIREAGFACEPHLTLAPERVLEVCRRGRADFYSAPFLKECVEADCELFSRLRPDLVLSDFRFSVSTSAELMGIAHVVTLNALWTNYFSAPLSAPEGTVYEKIFGKELVSRFPKGLVKLIKEATLRYDVQAHNRVRRYYDLPDRRNLFDLVAGDLNLIADIPTYGPTKNLPSHFAYVGPILWQPEIPLPEWFSSLDEARPTIYVSMGSTGDARVFHELVEAFAECETQWLFTTAGMIELPSLPSNIKVVDFAPGSEFMKKADLVVCQGGNGTVYQALREGLPVLGYPTMHDQHFNMDQVERIGMGHRLSLSPFRLEELEAAVQFVFSRRGSYEARAKGLQEEFRRYPGESAAARAIDAFLGSPLPVARPMPRIAPRADETEFPVSTPDAAVGTEASR